MRAWFKRLFCRLGFHRVGDATYGTLEECGDDRCPNFWREFE